MFQFPSFQRNPGLLSATEEARYRLDHLSADGRVLASIGVLFGLVYALLLSADHALLGCTPGFGVLLAVRLGFIGLCATMAVALPKARTTKVLERWALAFGAALLVSNLFVLASRPRTYNQNVTLEIVSLLALYATLPDRLWIKAAVPVVSSIPSLCFVLFLKVHPDLVALLSILLAYGTAHLIGLGAALRMSHGRRQAWKREQELLLLVQERTKLATLQETLIATVSHEFRTPLQAIASSNDILERHRDTLDTAQFQEMTGRIRASLQHLTHMIERVLLVQPLDQGGPLGQPLDIELTSWIQALAITLQTGPGQPTLVLDLAPDLGSARLDEDSLRRVLGNLLSNALKYTPPEGRVVLRAQWSGPDLFLEVEDTGIGIPRAEQELVFTRFHRGSNARGLRGTGLGLTIVQEALTRLGGELSLDSQEGRGTRIRVALRGLRGDAHGD